MNRYVLAVGLAFALCACGGSDGNGESDGLQTTGQDVQETTGTDDGGGGDGTQPLDMGGGIDIDEPEVKEGSMEGRFVGVNGEAVGLAYVLVCDVGSCTSGQLDPNGYFLMEALEVGPYKVQVLADDLGYMNLEYPLLVEENTLATPGQDIVMVARADDPVVWDVELGGTVKVADGALELSAGPGELAFPLGIKKEVWAAPVAVEHLQPFGVTPPWADNPESVVAFHINPLGTATTGATFNFSIHVEGLKNGTAYAAWSVDVDTGMLELVGSAVANSVGQIVSGADLQLLELTTLILVAE